MVATSYTCNGCYTWSGTDDTCDWVGAYEIGISADSSGYSHNGSEYRHTRNSARQLLTALRKAAARRRCSPPPFAEREPPPAQTISERPLFVAKRSRPRCEAGLGIRNFRRLA